MDPGDRAHALDLLAGELRERLLREVEGDGEREDAHARIRALVEREAGALAAAERAELTARIAERSFGLGPLEPLLRDPAVEEIMVSGTAPVWIEREGRLASTAVRFASEAQLRHAIERILAPLGRRVDEAEPLCDARLPDGSRVNVVLPPLALDGPALTIRRFRARGFSADDLVAAGTLPAPLADFLARAVRARCTILVCGGTGSGKTTTLNALSGFIPPGERVVTIEDSAELRLRRPHVIRLEARPPNVEGRGEVTIRRLVRNALRMRPDRIVVGEVRGAEALDMLTALTTGHAGSLSTIHAGDATEALRRLETLALMAGLGLPHAAIREQVADAIDLVVVQARGYDGARRVVGVSEVVRAAGGAGVRELYALRGGRPCWRAPLGDSLAGRLAAPDGPARGLPPEGQGSGARPEGQGSGARPEGQRSGARPEGQGSGAPPEGRGSGAQPEGQGSGARPEGQGSGARPEGQGSGARPEGQGSGARPEGQRSGARPEGQGSGAPPEGRESGTAAERGGSG